MKNIHIISTDKPSRLQLQMNGNLHIENGQSIALRSYQNIYITSDEEIKEGDWYIIEFNSTKITKCTSEQELISIEGRNDCKKIILTTDQELIKDGVQAIDDEFLEWFIKNPSCEKVEIKHIIKEYVDDQDAYGYDVDYYKIIIPKEEAKQDKFEHIPYKGNVWEPPVQETLEEAVNKTYCFYGDVELREAFELGAKWQAERMYSEEEVKDMLQKRLQSVGIFSSKEATEVWFKQYKKQ